MTETCRPAKCIEAIRIALLDQCTLLPVCGPMVGYAMGCIIDPDWSPEIEEGDESLVKDNCGNICWQDVVCDLTKRWNGEFKLKGPDPEFLSLIGNDNLIVVEGESIGVQHGVHCSPWLYLDLFERTDDCDEAGEPVYLRHVFPRARLTWTGNEKEGIFRLLQIEFKALEVPIADIGTGPYGDIPPEAILSAPGEKSAYIEFYDTTPPVVQCGAIDIPCSDCEAPVISSITTDCPTFTINGTCLDLVNQVQVEGCFGIDAYDPAGPDSGSTHPWLQVNSWTPTQIVIEVVNLNGFLGNNCQIANLTLFGPGGTPNYGTFDAPDSLGCPQLTSMDSPACDTICYHGVNLLVADKIQTGGSGTAGGSYYNPAGPNAGLNGSAVVTWTNTQICITQANFNAGTFNSGHLYGVGGTPDFSGTGFAPVTPADCPNPSFDDVFSPECCRLVIQGDDLDAVNHLLIVDLGLNYYDPAGPDAGLNPGSATINEWDANAIDITDTQLCDQEIDGNIHIWGVGDTPDYGNHGAGPFHIDECPPPFEPLITNASSPDCDTIQIDGSGFDAVNRVTIGAIVGADANYYDPAGPDSGLNPGTATILSWTPTQIVIVDTAFTAGYTVGAIHMWAVGDFPNTDFNVDDFEVTPCPDGPVIESLVSESCGCFTLTGTGLDTINHISLQRFDDSNLDFYDPNGPDAPFNPANTYIDTWNATTIHICQTGQLEDSTIELITTYAPGDTNPVVFDVEPDVHVDDCPSPGFADRSSPSCDTFHIDGFNLNLINELSLNTDMGTFSYFDPNGPNAGSNPGTATIVQWDGNVIEIFDTQLGGVTVSSYDQAGVDPFPIYTTVSFPDQLVAACTPVIDSATAPDCFTLDLVGSGFDGVDALQLSGGGPGPYYDPNGPNAGSNPPSAVINAWTNTHISITDNQAFYGTTNGVHMWGVGLTPDYGELPYPEITLFQCPYVNTSGSENCEEFVLNGAWFDSLVNHIQINTVGCGMHDYYDPAGPDNGSNPGSATIIEWDFDTIRINDTALSGCDVLSVHFWGVGDDPDYGVSDLVEFNVGDCADTPGVTDSDSPQCQMFDVSGTRFDLVDHIRVTTDNGVIDYYDPAGPNAGSNPGTAQIVGWTSSFIRVYDTQIANYTVQTIQLFDVGDGTDFGTFDVLDYLVEDCPTPSLLTGNDSGVDRFQLHGTGFDALNHIRVITAGPTSDYDYFDPNGPNAAFNPGFVTVLSWTDTLIEIQHTGINAVITGVHLWGCCGPLGDPDFGLQDIPDFLVN